jgi:g-D-glutamyl-meso-diaminopimelate peptidase
MNEKIVNRIGHYGYERLLQDLQELKAAYPFIKLSSIGSSVCGREIPAVRIGTGAKKVHYNAAFHANEWITSPLLMTFLEELASAHKQGKEVRGKKISRILSEVSLWLVPMVNPDGVELSLHHLQPDHPNYTQLLEWNRGSHEFHNWKANARGVDLNDQFPAYWEVERDRRAVDQPGERDYTGTAPLTEPEAVAMAAFTREHEFELVIALHSQGKEIYWNYRDMEPLRSIVIAEIFAEASGYRAVKLTGSDAGYKDWFIKEFGRPGFTVEVGLGTNPLPAQSFPQMYEEVVGILLEGLCV